MSENDADFAAPDHGQLELVEIERRGVVIDENLKNIQRACLTQRCPVVIGQKGVCYKIMRNIDQGSFGMIFNTRQITELRQTLHNHKFDGSYELVIKIFDVN